MPDPAHPHQKYLDPFIFPAETDSLFSLMILSALMLAVNQSFLLVLFLDPDSESVYGQALGLTIALVIVIFVAAFVLYQAYPKLIQRKFRLESYPIEQKAAFFQPFTEIVAAIGLTSIPQIFRQRSQSDAALAFGAGRKEFLRLDTGLLTIQLKAPERFWALVLHELAHFRNRDVKRYYFAKSLTWAVTLIVVVPFTLLIIGTFVASFFNGPKPPAALAAKFGYFLMLMVQTTAVLLGFVLIRSKLLRVREYYADYRASGWGAREPLLDLLAEKIDDDEPVGFIKGLKSSHPTLRGRLENLRDANAVFRLTKGLPFIASVLLTSLMQGIILIIFVVLVMVVGQFIAAGESFVASVGISKDYSLVYPVLVLVEIITVVILATVIGTLFFLMYLAVRSFAVQIFRESIADLVKSDEPGLRPGRFLLIAVLMACGYEIGFLITPLAFFAPKNFDGIGTLLLWFPVTIFLAWISLLYTRNVGLGILGRRAGSRAPQWSLRAWLIVVTVLFCLPFLTQMTIRLSNLERLNPQNKSFFLNLIPLSAVITLVVYGLVFAITWVITRLSSNWASGSCANCKAALASRLRVGKSCGYCGTSLSRWIYGEQKELI